MSASQLYLHMGYIWRRKKKKAMTGAKQGLLQLLRVLSAYY